jgi:predicted nucleic acid-binding protein
MTRLLLDTSAYSALLRGHEEIQKHLRGAEEICVNPIVLGELRAGFGRGRQSKKNEGYLQRFISSSRVAILSIDAETSERYAFILNALWKAGTPAPTNDIWIAASAMQHGLAVLTTDSHFLNISQVIVYQIALSK